MKNSIKNKVMDFFETKQNLIAFTLLYLILIITSCIFFFDNNLLAWDHYGHIDSAATIMEQSWPNPVTWNSNYFNGYPQNYFYPPLASWLVATIAILTMSTPIIAYKLLLIAIYLLMPVLFYAFSKIFTKDKKTRLIITLTLMAITFIQDAYFYGKAAGLGGTIWSTFYVGLAPAFLAFILLILFITLYERGTHWSKLGIVFALGLLAHYFFLVSIIYILIDMIFSKGKTIKRGILVIITGLILSSFFWVPLLQMVGYVVTAPFEVTFVNGTITFIALAFICLIALKKHTNEKKFYLIAFIIFLAINIGRDLLVFGQFFRLVYIVSFLSTPLIIAGGLILIEKFEKKNKVVKWFSINLPIIIAIAILLLSLQIDFTSISSVQINTVEKTQNTYITIGPDFELRPAHHALFYEFKNQTGNRQLKGLFVEQTPEIEFFSGLYLFVNPDEFLWGTRSVKREFIDPDNIVYLLNYFNVSSIISTEKISAELPIEKFRIIGKQIISTSENKQKLLWFDLNKTQTELQIAEFRIADTNYIEIINKPLFLYQASENWISFSNRFLLENKQILIRANDPVDTNKDFDFEIDTNAVIRNVVQKAGKISFYIDSNVNVPVLIKENYFPDWKAKIDGKSAKIFTAAPFQMVVIGKGQVELTFEENDTEIVTKIISLIGLIVLIIIAIKNTKFK